MAGERSGWGIDLAVGGLCGLIAGAIVAVNLIIFMGVEGGYEAGVGDVFSHSILLGILVISVLVAGPLCAVAYARLLRRRRDVSRNRVDIHCAPSDGPIESSPTLPDRGRRVRGI
ncbi:MAG TPA: hypothetical protein VFT85_07885 [Acidimicrobiia bacterium]|nr:hypothetical protein [Acidimicrobiia bacterium]